MNINYLININTDIVIFIIKFFKLFFFLMNRTNIYLNVNVFFLKDTPTHRNTNKNRFYSFIIFKPIIIIKIINNHHSERFIFFNSSCVVLLDKLICNKKIFFIKSNLIIIKKNNY